MAKAYAESFYKSNTWKQCRANYLKSVGGLCERCLSRGLFVPAVIVHHKQYISEQNINDPSITLNHNNLEALCRECHRKEHDKFADERMPRRYMVDRFGKIISVDDAEKIV